jgi:hypothetical protein
VHKSTTKKLEVGARHFDAVRRYFASEATKASIQAFVDGVRGSSLDLEFTPDGMVVEKGKSVLPGNLLIYYKPYKPVKLDAFMSLGALSLQEIQNRLGSVNGVTGSGSPAYSTDDLERIFKNLAYDILGASSADDKSAIDEHLKGLPGIPEKSYPLRDLAQSFMEPLAELSERLVDAQSTFYVGLGDYVGRGGNNSQRKLELKPSFQIPHDLGGYVKTENDGEMLPEEYWTYTDDELITKKRSNSYNLDDIKADLEEFILVKGGADDDDVKAARAKAINASRLNEQGALFTVKYKLTAVQGTKKAVKDIFGDPIADAFDSFLTDNN